MNKFLIYLFLINSRGISIFKGKYKEKCEVLDIKGIFICEEINNKELEENSGCYEIEWKNNLTENKQIIRANSYSFIEKQFKKLSEASGAVINCYTNIEESNYTKNLTAVMLIYLGVLFFFVLNDCYSALNEKETEEDKGFYIFISSID